MAVDMKRKYAKMLVTVEILSSVGEKAILAIRSQNMQNTAPPRKVPGITTIGLDVFRSLFTRKGTAMPTKDMGPAKAVTVAERMLESIIRMILSGYTGLCMRDMR